MKTILVDVTIISAKDGSHIRKKFPLDEGMFKAIKSLSEDEQLKYFTEEYREWKHEENIQKHYGGSLDSTDELYDFAHDVPDSALNPCEYCLEQEKNELLKEALAKLTKLQYLVVYKTFFEEKTQQQISDELAITQQAIARILDRALASLRKILRDKFASDRL